MPKIKASNIMMNFDQQGSGEPLILIPYLAADHACYAFQVAEYAKHFTCISLDLRGTGETDQPERVYSTELLADDVAAFMQATRIRKAHISGLSLGAAIGMWLAAKHPDKVQSLSLHSGWPKTDPFLRAVVEPLQVIAKSLGVFRKWLFSHSSRGALLLSCMPPSPITSSHWPILCEAVQHSL